MIHVFFFLLGPASIEATNRFRINHFRRRKASLGKLTVSFKCKDFLLKDCEFEIKGAHSIDEVMKLVEVHANEEHRTLKVSPETRERIRRSLRESP